VAPEIDRFFASYRAAFDRLDAAAIAAHYAVPSILCTPTGRVAWTDPAAVIENMRQVCERYRAGGYRHASWETVVDGARGASHATVDLLWTVEREGGLPPWRFRTGYELQRVDGAWRIVLCVAYEEGDASDHSGPR
jgi:ketosteroid isomerase-like protein